MKTEDYPDENSLLTHYQKDGLPLVLRLIIEELDKIEGLAVTAEKSIKLSNSDAFHEQQVMNVAGDLAFGLRMKVEALQASFEDEGGES